MKKAKSIGEILDQRDNIKPIGDANGVKLVTYDEITSISMAEQMDKTIDMGDRTVNPDGTIARSRVLYAAVNPENLYINRFRTLHTEDGDKMEIVVDYRAIREQERGQIYVQRIPSYIIARNSKGKLFVEKMTSVKDTEFVSEFTHKLNINAMKEIFDLIASEGTSISTEDITI